MTIQRHTDPSTIEVARKLLETLHLNVLDRQELKGGGIHMSALVEGARAALDENPWLPSRLRPTGAFDGVLIERRGNAEYWVHERHEIGIGRFSEVQSRQVADLSEAVREYIAPYGDSIDGVAIMDG